MLFEYSFKLGVVLISRTSASSTSQPRLGLGRQSGLAALQQLRVSGGPIFSSTVSTQYHYLELSRLSRTWEPLFGSEPEAYESKCVRVEEPRIDCTYSNEGNPCHVV